MSLSLSQASLPVISQLLAAMTGVLDKTSAHVAERKLDANAILLARLYPDMYPFAKQIQVLSSWAVNIPAMVLGVTPPARSDDGTMDSLKMRLAAAADYVRAVDAAAIDAASDKVLSFPAGANQRRMKAKDFVLHYSMLHFYFHCTTAYDIARHNGVPLAKRDFMGPVQGIIEG